MNEMRATDPRSSTNAVERIAQDLLEALDALGIVYECAESFSRLFDAEAIASFALERVLEAVQVERGLALLDRGGLLMPSAERGAAAQLLSPAALQRLAQRGSAAFFHAEPADGLLAPGAGERALLWAPISDGRQSFGALVLLSEPGASFVTADLKLVTAVASQAAIALGGCMHFAAVLLERAKLHSVIQDNAEGIVVLEPDGRAALTNAAARTLLELAPDEPEGFDLLARLTPSWRGVEGLQALRRGELSELRLELVRGEGAAERAIACAARAVRGADGRIANLLLSLHDLTEKRREERVKRSFLALVSHKLRTPLAAVKGIVAMLQDESSAYAPSAVERAELLLAVDERVDELAGMVDRLLGMVEVFEGSWAALGRADLRVVATQALEACAERAARLGVELACTIAEEARCVSIPSSRLRLVLDNLLDNALKFGARRGGRITISAQLDGAEQVALDCSDDGPGLSRRDGAVLFETFRQRDEEFCGSVPGMGIGLALVREIARKVGGSAELVGGSGSRFRVRLPRARIADGSLSI
ncbi:MAG: GAF domain-containing sensor histidine kinase [Planctomycetes bacterium]|nr:GAF domain-containing sensor histidine kinase [Planctomycetota bacterium]